jgi:glucose-1-phosphate cytidylyltransferase
MGVMMEQNIPVVILCGGMGTRLSEQTEVRPKPLVEIGGRPILWHIMKIYSQFGFNEFILALGYKGELIKHYFLDFYSLSRDFTLSLEDGQVHTYTQNSIEPWKIHLIDTGQSTQTGGRLKRLQDVIGNRTFLMTYGDGVADVNIGEIVTFHRQHDKLATITAVRPPARFGGLCFDGDMVIRFEEKPQIGEGWINGGFFVLEPQVLDFVKDDSTIWEKEPLEHLAQTGQLTAFRHNGFWQCMDTLRDVRLLESLWEGGSPPWKIWR